MTRSDGRRPEAPRPSRVELNPAPYAEGSCLIETGSTRILCAASVEEELPAWRAGGTRGWVTAEYSMLPRATHTRRRRERGSLGGRTQEIQRLIGRSLRGVMDLEALGPRTIIVDCDVIQADGGTRTAAITGGWIALSLACRGLLEEGIIERQAVREQVAAISAGIVDGVPLLDLNYEEDSRAEIDLNVVGTGEGAFVEIQGTAEGRPFSRTQLDDLLGLATEGIDTLLMAQRHALEVEGG